MRMFRTSHLDGLLVLLNSGAGADTHAFHHIVPRSPIKILLSSTWEDLQASPGSGERSYYFLQTRCGS
jgi:hypothetical protein